MVGGGGMVKWKLKDVESCLMGSGLLRDGLVMDKKLDKKD